MLNDNVSRAHKQDKRKIRVSQQFSARLIEMLESPAYRALSLSAHRVIARIEIELARHGGHDNGKLAVTKLDFVDYGMHPKAVAPAIRETVALGFVKVERGRGGNAEHRPSLFGLTFSHHRNSRIAPPTHDWRNIETIEEALAIAQRARDAKSMAAVSMGRWAAHKNISRGRKTPIPGPETDPETAHFPGPETDPTASISRGRKTTPLSRPFRVSRKSEAQQASGAGTGSEPSGASERSGGSDASKRADAAADVIFDGGAGWFVPLGSMARH